MNNMNNNLNQFNTGGSHSENIHGGIPVGQDPNGVSNTVEENETMFNDFVFSDRIVLRPDVISQVGLPKTLANKTVAEATKLIDKQFKDRNSKVDKSTRDAMYDRIAQAQEMIKVEEQAKIAQAQAMNSTEVPDMMDGQIPQGMDQFMQPEAGMEQLPMEAQDDRVQSGMQDLGQSMFKYGGKVNRFNDGGTMFNPQTISAGIGAISGGMMLTDQLKGNTTTDTGGAVLGGASMGASIGSIAGPWGAAAGAGIGAITGIIGSNKARQKERQARINRERKEYYDNYIAPTVNNDDTQVFAYGGKVNKFVNGGDTDRKKLNAVQPVSVGFDTSTQMGNEFKDAWDFARNNEFQQSIPFPTTYQETQTTTTPQNRNYGNLLRYAPTAINAYQLATLKKPQTNRLQRLNNQYQRQFLDEATYQNIAREQASAARNAIGRSGATTGQMIGAQLGTQLGASKAVADSYNQIRQHNIGENKLRQQTQFGNNQFNIQQDNLEQDINDRNKANYQTQRSKLLGQLGNDLGSIGREEVYKDMAKEATGYDWMGRYMTSNPNATKAEVEKAYKKVNPKASQKEINEAYSKIKENKSTNNKAEVSEAEQKNRNLLNWYKNNGYGDSPAAIELERMLEGTNQNKLGGILNRKLR